MPELSQSFKTLEQSSAVSVDVAGVPAIGKFILPWVFGAWPPMEMTTPVGLMK